MKLSLWILHDWLNEFTPEISCTRPNHEISGVRLYEPGQTITSYALYIGREDDFLHNGGTRVMCKINEDWMRFETDRLTSVLNRIQDAFSFYSRWYDSCLDAIQQGCSLQDLVDIAGKVFKHPLVVINAAQYVIAQTGNLENVYTPKNLESILETNQLPEDTLIQFNQEYKDTFYKTEIQVIPAGFFRAKGYSKHLFSSEGERLGTVILKVPEEEDSPTHQYMLRRFSELLELWINSSYDRTGTFRLTSYFISALNGDETALEPLQRQLALFRWKPQCKKQVLVICSPSKKVKFDLYACRDLTENDLSIYAAPYQGQLVILCNEDQIIDASFKKHLDLLLQERGYCAGFSFAFADLKLLGQSYQQALMVLEQSELAPGKTYNCKDIVLYLVAKLIDETSVALVHPFVPFLKEYDRRHNSDYSRTLFVFLLNERNHVKASESLSIHRNTLFQRLDKIKELWPIDLEDAEERNYLLFSFYQDQLNLHPEDEADPPKKKRASRKKK